MTDEAEFTLLMDYHYHRSHAAAASVSEGPCRVRQAPDVVEHYLVAQRDGAIPRHREAFAVLLLDARHAPIALHVVSIGTLNSSPVHPREVFRPAIAAGAQAIVLAHHHPSGDATPSHEDRRITDRLTEAGELLGIQVLDHIVIGLAQHFSFSDNSTNPNPRIQLR